MATALREERAAEVRAPMTAAEARRLTDRIRESVDALWALLLEAYERRAWRALGYETWQAYVETEFSMSRRHSYRLLDQGRVIRELAAASGVDVTRVSHVSVREAAEVAPALPEITEEIRERVRAGEAPEEVVPDVVRRHRPAKPAPAPAPAPAPDDGPEDAPVDLVAELEAAHRDIERLEAEVASLTSSDLAAEVHRWATRYAQLEGRLRQEIATSREAQRLARRQGELLRQIREALGVERNSEILPQLRELLP